MVLPRQSVVKSVESRHVLEDLKMALENAGTSFDNVVMGHAFFSGHGSKRTRNEGNSEVLDVDPQLSNRARVS